MIGLKHPWLLALVALVPLIWWAYLSTRRRATIRFSGVGRLKAAGRSWTVRARLLLLPALRSLAVILIILSVARPQRADETTLVQTEGIAIQLVVDRSSSMNQGDFIDERGQPQTRLDAVKDVVKAFVGGDGGELGGRQNDLIGLIAFAHYADTECPLTHDHAHLNRALQNVQIPETRDEDGTAIGDALLLAVERIRNIERRFHEDDAFKVTSRVIVLLTDGMQNRGKYEPQESAEVAAALGVKVYTIGAAPDYTEEQIGGLLFEPMRIRRPVEIDEESLQEVADITGGEYFRAKTESSLREIYAEIDRLERSVIEEERYNVYEELAHEWADVGGIRLPPPLLAALIAVALEIALAATRLRKIP